MQKYERLKSAKSFAKIIGIVFRLVVLKHYAKFSDPLALSVATFSTSLDALLIGVAQSSTLIYV